MKHVKLFFALFAMFALGVGNAWAADSTVTFGTDWNTVFGTNYNGSFSPSKNALTLTGTIDAVTLTAKNGTSTNGYVKTSDWRLYNGYTLTIAVQEGNAISKITAQKGGKTITGITANEGNLEISGDGASMTWTGNTNEVVFSISATMGFSEISVTYSATGSTSKETTSLTWSADAYAATIGAENTFPTLTTDPVDLEGVTYSSSNVAAATIAADGTITLVAPGTTNITASFAGNETHYAATAASYKLTVKNSLENAVPYELHTGNLVEGDYVVFYANNGMKAQVVSNRLSYTEYIPEADVIYDPSADDVWHISKNGDYWTLYNAATAKYAAGNGTKNQAALVDNVGDAALWTATMTDGTFEFVNKKNNDASVNKNLRYNAGYGFACYGTSTGGALSLYKKVVANDAVTSPIISGNAEFVESTEVTIVAEDGLKVYYTLDGTDPTNASTEYTAPFELTATTTVKAVAYDGEKASDIISKTFKQLQVLTCEEAAELCAATESADKYVIRGYVTNIATAWSDQYSNISFWMADTKDGGKVFEAFRVQPIIAAEKSVKVGDYVEVIGKIVLYGTTPETTQGGTYTIIPAPVVNHTITVSANPAEAGTVTGGGEFEETDEITVKAVANEGYEFVNWTEGETVVSTEANYSFEVLADRALVANFKEVEPEVIAYELNGGELVVEVPTQEELWASFKTAAGLTTLGTLAEITEAGAGKPHNEQDNPCACRIICAKLLDANVNAIFALPEWAWLKAYIMTVQSGLPEASSAAWRYAIAAFFLQSQHSAYPTSADFTEAGKPEAWGAAYQAAHAVVLPTEPVDAPYTLPTPVKEGYTFVGWYDNAEGTGEAYTVIPAGWSGTLYAIWKQSPTTALDNIAIEGKVVKTIINGQLIIIKNGVQYNAQGQVIK